MPHVHIGLAIFVIVALLTRRRMRSGLPLCIVTAVPLANETIDYLGPDKYSVGVLGTRSGQHAGVAGRAVPARPSRQERHGAGCDTDLSADHPGDVGPPNTHLNMAL